MEQRTVAAGVFKATCLALLDEVAATLVPIVVTKRGRPVARIVPIADERMPMENSVTIYTDNIEDLFTALEPWPEPTLPE